MLLLSLLASLDLLLWTRSPLWVLDLRESADLEGDPLLLEPRESFLETERDPFLLGERESFLEGVLESLLDLEGFLRLSLLLSREPALEEREEE